MMRVINHLYNRWTLARHGVRYATFPMISGRILISKFAKGGTITLGRNVLINSSIAANPVGGYRSVFLIRGDNAVIEIGDDTLMSNVVIGAYTHIRIGSGVNIGAGTKIFDNDFHSLVHAERSKPYDSDIRTRPVVIKDRAFIGGDVIIMKGVTIGEEAVIGIGSVVTRDVPGGEIWAGNPAQFIGRVPAAART